jgi:O-antigen ligase
MIKLSRILFYCLIAYLPFQVALNLGADYDLASGRVFILLLFAGWLLVVLREKKSLTIDARIVLPLAFFLLLAALSFFWAPSQAWTIRKILFLASIAPIFLLARCYFPSFIKEGVRGGNLKFKNYPTLPLPSTEGRENAALRSELSRSAAGNFLLVLIIPAIISALIALVQFLAQFVFSLDTVMEFWSRYIAPLWWGQNFGGLVISNPSWLVDVNGQTIMRAIGLFPDPHMLAFYLGMIMPLVLAYLLFGQKNKMALFILYCLLLIVFCLTFSRGGYFGLLASLTLVMVKAWPSLSGVARKFMLSSLALVILLFFWTGISPVTRLISSFDLNEGSNVGRLANWSQSLTVAKSNPVLGVGFGNYSFAVEPSVDYRNAISSHNLYLDILAELGIFGLLAWLAVWSAIGRGFIKLRLGGSQSVFLLGIYGGLIYFAVHSIFETAMFNPTIAAMLMIYLGIISDGYRSNGMVLKK